MGLLEVCAFLVRCLEMLSQPATSHTRARHVEREEGTILQAISRPLKLHTVAMHSSIFWCGSHELLALVS